MGRQLKVFVILKRVEEHPMALVRTERSSSIGGTAQRIEDVRASRGLGCA